MKTALKITACAFALAVFLSFTFLRRELPVPGPVLDLISRHLSPEGWLFRTESASYIFPGRLRLRGARLLDCSKAESKPFASADGIDIGFTLLRFPWRLSNLVRSVSITHPRFPRLGDGYYIPDSIEFPGSFDYTGTDSPVDLEIPPFAPVSFEAIDAEILGIEAQKVSCVLRSAGNRLDASSISISFPDRDAKLEISGECTVDVPAQRVSGSVHGQARQSNIRPMLVALDITNSYQFVDAFTGVELPVDAGCRFDVNLRNLDLRIFLDLHPTGGAYNGVPLVNAQGNVDVRVFVRDHFQNARITAGPIAAALADGGFVSGTVLYENTNDMGFVTFSGVRSTTSLSNALDIAEILNDGTLDCLQPETPPEIALEGILAVDPANAATNRLDGSISFDRGRFFGIPLANARVPFHMRGESVSFDGASSSMPHGGSLHGSGKIMFPGFDADKATFSVSVKGDSLSLADVAEAIGTGTEDRSGTVSGSVSFDAPLSAALASHVNGKASLKVENGHLARLNLFAGLTDWLAKNIPGITSIVDQSDASMECIISNGVLRASKVDVSGDVFHITGSGTYSLPEDNLDFKVRVRLFRNDSILGRVANPITWTFSKLLLEFKVHGPLDNPEWNYISVLERLL